MVCGPNQYHGEVHDMLTNPALIVEVLSPGTAAFDKDDKFTLYQHSSSLQKLFELVKCVFDGTPDMGNPNETLSR